MSGFFGFFSDGGTGDSAGMQAMFAKLQQLCESRGRRTAGLAAMDMKRGTAVSRAGRVQMRSLCRDIAVDPSARTAWIGAAGFSADNRDCSQLYFQPAVSGTVCCVSSGILVNKDSLRKELPEGDSLPGSDAAVFASLLDRQCAAGPLSGTFGRLYEQCTGNWSVLALVHRWHCLLAATRTGSLFYCRSKDGKSMLFASENVFLQQVIGSCAFASARFSADCMTRLPAGHALVLPLDTGSPVIWNLCKAAGAPEIVPDASAGPLTVLGDREKTVVHPAVFDISLYRKFDIDPESARSLRRCTKCVLPETMPFIEFDEQGVCNYCRCYDLRKKQRDALRQSWGCSGEELVRQKAAELRSRGGMYDSLLSFSGGRDSCYGMHYFVRELGLHPIVYSYDWGMVTDLALRNQARMCEKLRLDFVVVTADLDMKRRNIRKNIAAWLKHPDLGLIPLFMAGDKQYFYYADKLCREYQVDTILMSINPLEETLFKSGFCHVKPALLRMSAGNGHIEQMPLSAVARMAGYYVRQYLGNPAYVNSSVMDTASAVVSNYFLSHTDFRLFDYIPWDEETVNRTLQAEYGWETAPDTKTTWRIGDGTAPFYNYLYCRLAGFTENDTLRSNQVREGMLSRDKALELVYRDNQVRFESMKWYFDVIGMDMEDVLTRVAAIPRIF